MKLNEKHNSIIKILAYTDIAKKDIAKHCGVTEQTLYNWLKDKDFIESLKKAKSRFETAMEEFKNTKNTAKLMNDLLLKKTDHLILNELVETALNGNDFIKQKEKVEMLSNNVLDVIEKKLDEDSISSRLLIFYMDYYLDLIGTKEE